MSAQRVHVGDTIPCCIQVGHYGEHTARADCLLVDDVGRGYMPSERAA